MKRPELMKIGCYAYMVSRIKVGFTICFPRRGKFATKEDHEEIIQVLKHLGDNFWSIARFDPFSASRPKYLIVTTKDIEHWLKQGRLQLVEGSI